MNRDFRIEIFALVVKSKKNGDEVIVPEESNYVCGKYKEEQIKIWKMLFFVNISEANRINKVYLLLMKINMIIQLFKNLVYSYYAISMKRKTSANMAIVNIINEAGVTY